MAALDLTTNFTGTDWAIVAVYLAVSLAVGIFANRFVHTVKAYPKGNP